jgi:ligand-binding sensor domain-containing protein
VYSSSTVLGMSASQNADCTAGLFTNLDDTEAYCNGGARAIVRGSAGGFDLNLNLNTSANQLVGSGPPSNFWLVDQSSVFRGPLAVPTTLCSGFTRTVYATATDAWLGGDLGRVCHVMTDGGSEVLQVLGVTGPIDAVWSNGVDLWVASSSAIYLANGQAEFVLASGYGVSALAGADSTHLWAGTGDGEVLTRQADGGWLQVVPATGSTDITDIAALSANEVWVSVRGGMPLQISNGTVTPVQFPPRSPTTVRGVRGDDAGLLVYGANGKDGVVTRLIRRGH